MKPLASQNAANIASFAVLLSLGLSSTGCDDALTRVDLVADLRVLGARVEVDGEPERASPAPGEAASVRWLVADRHPAPPIGWAFAVCEAAPPGGSLPSCAAEPFASTLVSAPIAGEPSLDFVVPASTGAQALAVFGVVCPDSAPIVAGGAFDCTGPGGRVVSLDFPLETLELTNSNPVIDPAAFTLDGEALPEGLDCATLPSVTHGSSHTLELALVDTARDPLEHESDAEPAKETLQVSHVTTAGSLERAFTVFEASDSKLVTKVSWKAPGNVPADGFARLIFVVRDLRGGSDWIERAVCIDP